jgi:hypothetical protein
LRLEHLKPIHIDKEVAELLLTAIKGFNRADDLYFEWTAA